LRKLPVVGVTKGGTGDGRVAEEASGWSMQRGGLWVKNIITVREINTNSNSVRIGKLVCMNIIIVVGVVPGV
jgi:hypothetical protein